MKPANVAAVIARMAPGADVDLLTATVRQWKHLAALTQAEQEQLLLVSVVDRARRQIGLFLGILLTVSAVVIALIIYTMTMEKLKQIATLKLIGAPDRTIVGMIVQQALILGGGGLGDRARPDPAGQGLFPAPRGAGAVPRPGSGGHHLPRLHRRIGTGRARRHQGGPRHRARELTWRWATSWSTSPASPSTTARARPGSMRCARSTSR